MRKQTKIAAMVSAAALLTIGAAMTSSAAGWDSDDGGVTWFYLDKYGEKVENEWKKSGNNWYYLGGDGYIVTSTLLRDTGSSSEDIYYVNSAGVKQTNYWISVPNDDGFTINDHEPSTVYYYMGADGKATRATDTEYTVKSVKKNNNTTEKAYFIFDREGHMMTGWVDVDAGGKTGTYVNEDGYYRYYCGDEEEGDDAGVVRTGWQYLEDPEDVENEDPYETEHWYWFNETGKAAVPNSTRYIDGKYYHFGQGGFMDNGWFDFTLTSSNIASSPETNVGRTKSDGRMQTGWVQRQEDDSDETYWYYLINEKKDGRVYATVPFNRNGAGKMEGDDRDYAARSINNKIYLFNNHGQMVTGLTSDLTDWKDNDANDIVTGVDMDGDGAEDPVAALVYNSNGTLTKESSNGTNVVYLFADATYYFSNETNGEGQMARNAKTEVKIDGETYYYHFQKNGAAYTNAIVNGILYDNNGVRVNSDAGYMSYKPEKSVTYYTGSKKYVISGEIVVNASGHVRTLTIPKKDSLNAVSDKDYVVTSTVRIDGETYTVKWELLKAYKAKDGTNSEEYGVIRASVY